MHPLAAPFRALSRKFEQAPRATLVTTLCLAACGDESSDAEQEASASGFLEVSDSQADSSSDSESSESSTTSAGEGEPCLDIGEVSCLADGNALECSSTNEWIFVDCTERCQGQYDAPNFQQGWCLPIPEASRCMCADAWGQSCEGTAAASCADEQSVEFCSYGVMSTLWCSNACSLLDYPVAGPCVGDAADGDCQCADEQGSSCPANQEGVTQCADDQTLESCAGGTWWRIDCAAECERLGVPAGPCMGEPADPYCKCG